MQKLLPFPWVESTVEKSQKLFVFGAAGSAKMLRLHVVSCARHGGSGAFWLLDFRNCAASAMGAEVIAQFPAVASALTGKLEWKVRACCQQRCFMTRKECQSRRPSALCCQCHLLVMLPVAITRMFFHWQAKHREQQRLRKNTLFSDQNYFFSNIAVVDFVCFRKFCINLLEPRSLLAFFHQQ